MRPAAQGDRRMTRPPIWSEAPDDPTRPPTLRLIRCPHDRAIDLLPTSRRPLGTFTHFHLRRTIPCQGLPDCELCTQGIPFRWHGYIAAMLLPSREHVIFEYTAPHAQTFRQYLDEFQSLRGAHITARRIAPYPNARTTIAIRPAGPNAPTLYPEPNLAAILCAIWQVPTPQDNPQRLTEGHAIRIPTNPEPEDPRYRTTNNGKAPRR